MFPMAYIAAWLACSVAVGGLRTREISRVGEEDDLLVHTAGRSTSARLPHHFSVNVFT
jgi:hypothetical protein